MVTVHTLDRLPCDGPRKCDGSRNSDDPTRRVVYHNSRQLIHVVRFEYAGEVLPAKVAENTPTTSHSINSGGNTVSHNTWEYLSIRPNWSAVWMEYSLPLSAPSQPDPSSVDTSQMARLCMLLEYGWNPMVVLFLVISTHQQK